jgi:hypothetical protein
MLSLVLMRRLSLAVYAIALWSCAKPTVPFAVTTKTLAKQGPNFSLQLEYPEIAGAPDSLNQQLATEALTHLEQVEDDPIPFEEYAKNIAGDSAVTALANVSVMTVVHHTAAYVTTRCQTKDAVYFDSYALASGKHLELSDLLEPGKASALPAGTGPMEPTFGLVAGGLMWDGAEIPFTKLQGILKPAFIP